MQLRFGGVGLLLAVGSVGVPAAAGSGPPTAIPAIQGASHLSPLLGRRVTVEGVVTARRNDGFHLQDQRGDGDPATSDGIFVEGEGAAVVRGDRVRLEATVAERPGGGPAAGLTVTRLIEVGPLSVVSRGEPLPAPVRLGAGDRPFPRQIMSPEELPVDLRDPAQVRGNRFTPGTDVLDYLEALEGMLVSLPRPTALGPSEHRSRGRADVFVLPDPGPRHTRSHERTSPGGILLRSGPDNRGNQNTDRIRLAFDPVTAGGVFPALATGDRLADVTGVLDYAYGAFQVSTTSPVRVEARPDWTPEVTTLGRAPDAVTVATYNVLNLSPDSSDRRQRELLGAQVAGALGAPDIVALQEIQDESGERDDGAVDGRPTLAALVAAVRRAGGPAYAYLEAAPVDGRPGGVPGGNIRNAFLYDTARVRLVSYRPLTAEALAAADAPDPGAFAESRDPLEAVFAIGRERLVVINNHLTSRFGSTPVFGAVQPWVEAGEAEREAQARALHAYVAALIRRNGAARVVVLGDMNTFETTDDLASLLPGSPPLLVNLVPRVEQAQRYTYIFEGNSQVLDHVFVTPSLADRAEIDVVHLNADFPAATPASDHDPVVARFRW